jgi:hypothetical protein
MNRLRLAFATALLTGPSLLPAQRELGDVTTVQAPKNSTIQEVLYEDLSGDGRRDLILAVREKGKDYGRTLRIYLSKPGKTTFSQTPDTIVRIPRSVSACAIGDVHGDPGGEVLWFGARGVYAWRPNAPEKDRAVKLVASEFLFQYPHPKTVLSWQPGVKDLDGDGLSDLVLPEPDGYRIAIQKRDQAGAVTFSTSKLAVPPSPPRRQGAGQAPIRGSRQGDGFNINVSLGGTGSAGGPLVSVSESVAAPQFHDWDGDGDLDVIAKRSERVFVWRQLAKGRFAETPDLVLQFPLTDEQTRLDPRFSASLTDFNLDKRVDAVLVAKDGRSEELRTQIMFFPQKSGDAPLFAEGVPGQLLVLAGFTSRPRFRDIDGDGDDDMQISSWRLDVMDQLTTDKQVLPVDIYVYLNHKGRFSKRPDLTHKATLDGKVLGTSGDKLFVRFVGDISGDGVSELLVRDEPKRLKMLQVLSRRGKLKLILDPIWQLTVSEKAQIKYFAEETKQKGFLVVESNQVLLVRF